MSTLVTWANPKSPVLSLSSVQRLLVGVCWKHRSWGLNDRPSLSLSWGLESNTWCLRAGVL